MVDSPINTPKKGEFLPSDIWAKNIGGYKPESKRDENYVLWVALAILTVGLIVGSLQWVVPYVQDSNNHLIQEVRELQQRNLLLESHLRRSTKLHAKHFHNRRLLQDGTQNFEEEWESLNQEALVLLATKPADSVTEPPMQTNASNASAYDALAGLWDNSVLAGTPSTVYNTGAAVFDGVKKLSYNTGRSLLGWAPKKEHHSAQHHHQPTKSKLEHNTPKHYRKTRRIRSNGWQHKRKKQGLKKRKKVARQRLSRKHH